MSWPAPHFVPDLTPSNKLKLIHSCSPVRLVSDSKGELKNGTLLVGEGIIWYKKEDLTLLRLIYIWSRQPELTTGLLRTPKIEIYLGNYSSVPDFVFYFVNQQAAQITHKFLLDCSNYTPPVRTPQETTQQAFVTKIQGVAYVEQTQKQRIEDESRLTNQALTDLPELMKRAEDVLELVKKYQETLTASNHESEDFDSVLADIGIVDNPVSKTSSGKKYHEELALQISSFLEKRQPPVIVITLPDVYALYNRARGGAGLVSPNDVVSACKFMNYLSTQFEFITFPSGVLAVRNKAIYSEIFKACEHLKAAKTGFTPADLVREVSNLPLIAAKEWLIEQENERHLVRDRDQYGNIKWFSNIYFR